MSGVAADSAFAAVVLALAGFASAVLNVVAGGGSFIVLPILLFLGLPAADANGTNRVGILVQNAGAVWGFERSRVLDWRLALRASIPATLGAGFGAWLALLVDDRSFRRVLGTVMVLLTLWTLLDRRDAKPREATTASAGTLTFGFLAVGFYAGFIQAGVGFLIMAVASMAGLDLVRGNALKVTVVLILTILTLSIFLYNGRVRWGPGLALAVGSFAGGVVGAHLTVLKGQPFVRWVLLVTVVVFAALLWLQG